MQKSSILQGRRKCFEKLSANLTKLAQQIASSRPRSREHKKRRRSFFAYQGDQPVAEIFLSIISLKEDIPINIVFTDTAFCCLFEHFFIRSHDAVIADACRQYFIVFACLLFALEVVKFSHKLRFVSCFRMFFFQKWKRFNASH